MNMALFDKDEPHISGGGLFPSVGRAALASCPPEDQPSKALVCPIKQSAPVKGRAGRADTHTHVTHSIHDVTTDINSHLSMIRS